MFYIIGLGLSDEKDITIRGLEVRSHLLQWVLSLSVLCIGNQKLGESLSGSVHQHSYGGQGASGLSQRAECVFYSLIL